MNINALLSGLPAALVQSGTGAAAPKAAETAAGPAASSDARFEQGQWWRNMARAAGQAAGTGRQCSCRNCPACAAQAYSVQDAQGPQGAVAASGMVADSGRPSRENPAPAPSAGGTGGSSDPGGTEAVRPGGVPQQGSSEAGTAGAPGGNEEGESPAAEVATGPKGMDGEPLSREEQLQVAQLQQIDTKVKAHEMAHLAAAGSYARSGANFQYQKGPDGKSYAVGGEVSIDTGSESTPEATISKMQTVRAAALAPAEPSAQDRKVAAKASLTISEASQELQMIRLETRKGEAERQGSAQPAAEASEGAAPGVGTRPEDAAGQQDAAANQMSGQTAGQKAITAAFAKAQQPGMQAGFAITA